MRGAGMRYSPSMRTRAFRTTARATLAAAFLTTGCYEGAREALPAAHQLGRGDGTPGSVTLTVVLEPEPGREGTDLAFHPDRPSELWVLMRWPPIEDAYCIKAGIEDENKTVINHCVSYRGSVAIQPDATQPGSAWFRVDDPNAWHFMRRPPALAFGDNGNFANCGEARTGNYDDEEGDFIGPSLFSADLAVFGVEPPGEDKNGSHLDMLHASPWCTGIAHERDNVYWAVNGAVGSLDRYDFHQDHGPGNADHTDGEIWRYATGEIAREPWVPSHLVYRAADRHLYIADTGHGRVVKLDTSSGTVVGQFVPDYDGLVVHDIVDGAVITEVVPPGRVERPSGLALIEDMIFVADHATSTLYAFDYEGALVRRLDTGLPRNSITGLAIGPDDRLYFADRLTGRALRVDPR